MRGTRIPNKKQRRHFRQSPRKTTADNQGIGVFRAEMLGPLEGPVHLGIDPHAGDDENQQS